jgi:hypothetical protein
MSGDQNTRRSRNITIDNSSFEGVEDFKYLGKPLSNQNSIQAEIKSRYKSGDACYLSVQNALSSVLLSSNKKIKKYNFACFLYGCETWSLTLRKERRLRVFENKMLRRIFEALVEKTT